jgi:uncharacterized Fe-S cluster-containing radical SAM superfamily protein
MIRGMRQKVIDLESRRVLLADMRDSEEGSDSYADLNCGGFGRIRRYESFSIHLHHSMPGKPMYRGLPERTPFFTQVLQLAGCNWRCWYCFVDDALLSADKARSRWFTVEETFDLFLQDQRFDDVSAIDLSGGQPDLAPEWCLWTLQELDRRGLRDRLKVWIDDNLSGSFVHSYLTPEDIAYMANHPSHSRVGCFKGYNKESFVFNTNARPEAFEVQFRVIGELINSGFDMYAYATFTSPEQDPNISSNMRSFVDRLQAVHELLPLRTCPLEVKPFAAARGRMNQVMKASITRQQEAAAAWEEELRTRFSPTQLVQPFEGVALR